MVINTPADAKAYAVLLTAISEGKVIQEQYSATQWNDIAHPDLSKNHKVYRIKPSTKFYKVGIMRDTEGRACTILADDKQEADRIEARSGFSRWLTDWVEYELI